MCRVNLMLGAAFLASSIFVFWNLENCFDPFDDPLTQDDEWTPSGRRHWTWRKMDRKLTAVAKTLIASSEEFGDFPDIIALAEVENRLVLRRLVRETPLEKLDYGVIHRESPDRRGIDVALLYRKASFLPLEVDSIRLSVVSRDILHVKGVMHGDTIHIFVNHWPSKIGGSSSDRRSVAAETLSAAVDSIFSTDGGASVVACGDFNATPSEICLPQLRNMASALADGGAGTIKYRGTWDLIDQFLVRGGVFQGSRMVIYSPPFLLEKDAAYTGMRPLRTYNGPHYKGGISDHLPVFLLNSHL